MEVLTGIPVDLTPDIVLKRLRLRRENEAVEKSIRVLLEQALSVLNAKAVYEVAYIEDRNGDSLSLNDVKFTSRVLSMNLEQIGRVFPYIVTCGQEVDAISVAGSDYMDSFILDAIKEMAMRSAYSYLRGYLVHKFALGQVSTMTPGSLEDWPITQQKELFSIFGNVEDLIGVRLTPSFLMTPIKSISGIFFPTEVRFESCQLCSRKNCTGRRAPYDPKLAKKYGIIDK